jgi:hypothetical protein
MSDQGKKPLMRCLGEFFGNIAQGIRTNPESDAQRTEVNRTVEERTTDEGVILRRTTIDEVEVRHDDE